MRKLLLAIACGAVLAVPMGVAFGEDFGDPVASVPASDCPEAVAAREAAGLQPVDWFGGGCPDPSTIKPYVEEDVLERAAACEQYADKPAWCPTDEEVEAAQNESGGSK